MLSLHILHFCLKSSAQRPPFLRLDKAPLLSGGFLGAWVGQWLPMEESRSACEIFGMVGLFAPWDAAGTGWDPMGTLTKKTPAEVAIFPAQNWSSPAIRRWKWFHPLEWGHDRRKMF